MNTKVIGIIVAIVVIAAGVWYFTQNKGESGETKNESLSTDAEEQLEKENTSIKELMARGRDVVCTYDSADTGRGTIYASSGRARGDFEVKTDGKTSMGHMISDETTGYFWMEGQTSGMKMMMNKTDQSSSTSNQGVDPNKNYDFSCDPWRADASVFTPPTNVQFQEFNIPATPPGGAGTKMDSSAVCNSLPEPSKTQCLNSIKQ